MLADMEVNKVADMVADKKSVLHGVGHSGRHEGQGCTGRSF